MIKSKIITLAKTIPIDGIPTRVRLFKVGINQTSKGDFIYDPKNIPELLANQNNEDGRDKYPIDVAHLSLTDAPNPDAHAAVGWWDLEFDEDGIWADNIKWTPRGESYLQNREFRFISPAFKTRTEKDKTIVYIDNMTITNEPATYNPIPLVASKINMENSMSEQTDNKENKTEVEVESEYTEEKLSTAKLEDEGTEELPKEEIVPEAKAEEEEAPVEELADEKDTMIAELKAVVEELKSRLAVYEEEKVAASKQELLSKFSLSDKEKKYWLAKDIKDIEEYFSIDEVVLSKVEAKQELTSNKNKVVKLERPKLAVIDDTDANKSKNGVESEFYKLQKQMAERHYKEMYKLNK